MRTAHDTLPDGELWENADPAAWAAGFVSHAWWDRSFPLDENAVAIWFSWAMVASLREDVAGSVRDLCRAKRLLVLYDVLLLVLIVLVVAQAARGSW